MILEQLLTAFSMIGNDVLTVLKRPKIAHYAPPPWPWILFFVAAPAYIPGCSIRGRAICRSHQLPHALRQRLPDFCAFLSTIAAHSTGAALLISWKIFTGERADRGATKEQYVNISRIAGGVLVAAPHPLPRGWFRSASPYSYRSWQGRGGIHVLRWRGGRTHSWSRSSGVRNPPSLPAPPAPFKSASPAAHQSSFAKTTLAITVAPPPVWVAAVTLFTTALREQHLLRFFAKRSAPRRPMGTSAPPVAPLLAREPISPVPCRAT